MKKYISDLITKEEMEKWKNDDIIAITSGTGTGKSYFITKKLTKFAKERGERILFLVPRNSIAEQLEKELDIDDTHIQVKTYQWIETKVRVNEDYTNTFDYIVMDEVHYFLEDVTFNIQTDTSLHWAFQQQVKKIMLSATPQSLLKFLSVLGLETQYSYTVESDYSHIDKIKMIKDIDYVDFLMEYLRKIPKDEKALIFMPNVKDAVKLYEKFKYESTLFFSSSNRKNSKYLKHVNQDEYKYLINKRKIPKQFLFTTSVLEAGVTIQDSSLKHIFINSTHAVNIIQSVGRKRVIDKNDKATLYVQYYNKRSLNGSLQYTLRNLEHLDEFYSMSLENFYKKYPELTFGGNKEIKGFKFELSHQEGVGSYLVPRVSVPYYAFMSSRKNTLQEILDYEQDEAFLYYIADLFNKKPIEECVTMKLKPNELTLVEYLESKLDTRIYEKAEKDELIERINYRTNGRITRSPRQMSEGLEKRHIPYVITSHKDRTTVIEAWGVRMKNPYFNKTYWMVETTDIHNE